mmetsp:Transcript_2357/g.3780  ORF Transcript_2357/g.3780 Transcript_2357/m.3780 type:complete len:210 (+) Transcript_2357:236-865(+)
MPNTRIIRRHIVVTVGGQHTASRCSRQKSAPRASSQAGAGHERGHEGEGGGEGGGGGDGKGDGGGEDGGVEGDIMVPGGSGGESGGEGGGGGDGKGEGRSGEDSRTALGQTGGRAGGIGTLTASSVALWMLLAENSAAPPVRHSVNSRTKLMSVPTTVQRQNALEGHCLLLVRASVTRSTRPVLDSDRCSTRPVLAVPRFPCACQLRAS